MKERSVVKWLAEFAESHKKLYTASVVFATIGVLSGVAPYVLVSDMIVKLISGNKDWNTYLFDGAIMTVCWILRVTMHAVSTSCSHKATFAVLGNIRKRVCDKLSRIPLGYVLDESSGSLKNIMVERIDSIETTLAHILPEFTGNLLGSLSIFILMLCIDWRMALISLVSLIIGLIAYCGMMIGYKESYQNTVEKTKTLNDTAVEYINGIEVIKAFGRAQNSYEKFKIAVKEGASCYIEWMRRCDVFFAIAMMIAPCTAITAVPFGALWTMHGSLALSDYVSCLILSVGLITPIITCMSYSDDMAKIKVIIGEVTGILTQPELDRPSEKKKTPKGYDICLEGVNFGYHEKDVLHEVSMKIKEGTVNALVGPSGSGKSTIAKLIASLWDVKEGSITIGGVNIKELTQVQFNELVAYVSQDNFLFDDTIRENIRMGNIEATDEEVLEIARKSGCYDFIMNLENGFDTVVGGAGGHLSGGEKQRISIARAMLKDAPIVILDEATAYTDPENEAVIQSSVAKLVRGKTLIVIAHRLSTITDADQIFVVREGEIIEQGTHKELLSRNGLYKNMWEAHISVKDQVGCDVIRTMEGGEMNDRNLSKVF